MEIKFEYLASNWFYSDGFDFPVSKCGLIEVNYLDGFSYRQVRYDTWFV